jgi:hypothetical protein
LHDPKHEGVNFVFPVGLESIRVNLALKDATVDQLAQAVAKVARVDLQAEDDALTFLPRHAANSSLIQQRFFRVNPEGFAERVATALRRLRGPIEDATGPASTNLIANLQRLFAAAGVDSSPPKIRGYKPRLGWLMTSGTSAELETIGRALAAVDTPAGEIRLTTTVVVFPAEQGATVFRLLGLPERPSGIPIETDPQTSYSPRQAVPTMPRTGDSASVPFLWKLTAHQAATLLNGLRQTPKVRVLPSPDITTLSGLAAPIRLPEPPAIVTRLNALTESEFVTVIPSLVSDSIMVDLQIRQTAKHFIGYEFYDQRNTWDYVNSSGANVASTIAITAPSRPKPVYRLAERQTDARLWDGQALVLGGIPSPVADTPNQPGLLDIFDNPFGVGHTHRIKGIPPSLEESKIILVTPVAVDPEGRPLHNAGDFPFRDNAVPPNAR